MVDHGSDRNYWTDHDWSAAACVERDNSIDWQSCSVCHCQNLRLFCFSAVSGRYQWWTSQSMEKQDQLVLGNTLSQRFGSDRRKADGVRVEKFPGFTTLGILDEIQKMMTESKCEREKLIGQKRRNKENCIAKALRVTEYVRRFTRRHWSLLGPGSEKKRYGTHVNKPDGEWEKIAEGMMLNFTESGHPVFCACSALERGELKSKGNPLTSTVVRTPLNWFFAQLFQSISSVSTEQWQTCVEI